MEKLLFSLVIFFSFFFTISYREENIVLYGSTISSFFLIFYFILKILKVKKINIMITKHELILVLLIVLYMFYTLILGIIFGIENTSIYKVVYNNIYLLTFITILVQLGNFKKIYGKISKYVCYGFILISIISLIWYILNIYSVSFSFSQPFVSVYDEFEMINYFNEIRFQSMFSHKTKYAFYCIIGIFIIGINSSINKKMKYIGVILLVINIFLTGSISSMIASFFVLWFIIDFKKINRFIRYNFYLLAICIVVVSTVKIWGYMSSVRNIDTLGSRTLIWEYALDFVKEHPYGVIDNWYFYLLGNHFKGAHNVFLNEFLDYGIIGGIMFLIIFTYFTYSLFKLDKRALGLSVATLTVFMIDNILYYDIVPVFWLSYILIKIVVLNNERLKDSSTT